MALPNLEEFYLKIESGIGWNNTAASTAWAVGKIGRNDQFALSAGLHTDNSFGPSSDNALPDGEYKGLTSIEGAIKLPPAFTAFVQPSGVVDGDAIAGLHRVTLAFLAIDCL